MSQTQAGLDDFDSPDDDTVDETDTLSKWDPGYEPDPESDIGITNWNGVMQIWGDDYSQILYSEEIESDESVREHPYSVQRGDNV